MANMSYCRFRNTFNDLCDCYENWREDKDNLNGEERLARHRLLRLCRDIIDAYGEDDDNNKEA